MHNPEECDFCRQEVDYGIEWIGIMMHYIPDYSKKRKSNINPKKEVPELLPCERGYHPHGKPWFLTLALEQYSYGHSLFIIIKPYDDITDIENEDDKFLSEIFIGLHKCSRVIKDVLGAEKVYVSSLCDGVEHLHFHVIPRYHKDRTDFRFMADRARQYDQGNLFIAPMDKPRRKQYFEDLANSLKEKYTEVYGED